METNIVEMDINYILTKIKGYTCNIALGCILNTEMCTLLVAYMLD